MWIWHRKMTAENHGLALVKPATKDLCVADLPTNWRDHIEVVTKKPEQGACKRGRGRQTRFLRALWLPAARSSRWTRATRPQIESLMRTNFTTLWIADHHLLQTHTSALPV